MRTCGIITHMVEISMRGSDFLCSMFIFNLIETTPSYGWIPVVEERGSMALIFSIRNCAACLMGRASGKIRHNRGVMNIAPEQSKLTRADGQSNIMQLESIACGSNVNFDFATSSLQFSAYFPKLYCIAKLHVGGKAIKIT